VRRLVPWLLFCVAILAGSPAWAQKRAIIWLHGHPGGPRSPKIAQLRDQLSAHGIAVLAPDLNEGRGGAAGFTVSRSMQQVRHLLDREHIDEAVLIGHSMGGFTATQLAAKGDARLRGLVLLAPAFDGSESEGSAAAKDLLRHAPHPVVSHGIPVLVFHGSADTVVLPQTSRAFSARQTAAGHPVTLREVEGDDHALRFHNDEVVGEMRDFAARVLR
jgi:pimeloyl-ACP methyl ester carboxylesterase